MGQEDVDGAKGRQNWRSCSCLRVDLLICPDALAVYLWPCLYLYIPQLGTQDRLYAIQVTTLYFLQISPGTHLSSSSLERINNWMGGGLYAVCQAPTGTDATTTALRDIEVSCGNLSVGVDCVSPDMESDLGGDERQGTDEPKSPHTFQRYGVSH